MALKVDIRGCVKARERSDRLHQEERDIPAIVQARRLEFQTVPDTTKTLIRVVLGTACLAVVE